MALRIAVKNLKINNKMTPNKMVNISPNLIKTIKVRIGGDVYQQLRSQKPTLYKNTLIDGFDLKINYIDTWRKNHQFDKIIVAVHGTSNDFTTFYKVIEHFSRQNVRIIALNMPDFNHTINTKFSFWHTCLEKYQLLKNFLNQLEIKTIDCLLGHSAGILPISALWEKVLIY